MRPRFFAVFTPANWFAIPSYTCTPARVGSTKPTSFPGGHFGGALMGHGRAIQRRENRNQHTKAQQYPDARDYCRQKKAPGKGG